jgi:hypothetical protein
LAETLLSGEGLDVLHFYQFLGHLYLWFAWYVQNSEGDKSGFSAKLEVLPLVAVSLWYSCYSCCNKGYNCLVSVCASEMYL